MADRYLHTGPVLQVLFMPSEYEAYEDHERFAMSWGMVKSWLTATAVNYCQAIN